MHFSSPSGQRLSWCLPWNRGAVGTFSKGYCSVTGLRNIVRNVTPKPAIGSHNDSLIVAISGSPPLGWSQCVDAGAAALGSRQQKRRTLLLEQDQNRRRHPTRRARTS